MRVSNDLYSDDFYQHATYKRLLNNLCDLGTRNEQFYKTIAGHIETNNDIENVIDIGCGRAVLSHYLCNNTRYIGVDKNEYLIGELLARERTIKRGYLCMDVTSDNGIPYHGRSAFCFLYEFVNYFSEDALSTVLDNVLLGHDRAYLIFDLISRAEFKHRYSRRTEDVSETDMFGSAPTVCQAIHTILNHPLRGMTTFRYSSARDNTSELHITVYIHSLKSIINSIRSLGFSVVSSENIVSSREYSLYALEVGN